MKEECSNYELSARMNANRIVELKKERDWLEEKIAEQQREIGLLKAENESLAESNLCIREYETEIARLRRALQDHGRHERSCEQNDEGDDCTCGFTAALDAK